MNVKQQWKIPTGDPDTSHCPFLMSLLERPLWAASKSADSRAGLLGWELTLTSGETWLAYLVGVGQVEEESLSLNRLNKFLLKAHQVLNQVTRENLKLHGEPGQTSLPERAVVTLVKEFKNSSAGELVYLAQTDSWYLYCCLPAQDLLEPSKYGPPAIVRTPKMSTPPYERTNT